MAEKFDAVERDVGIITYLSPEIKGFAAVLKARFADFVVHEVNRNGKIARLTCMDAPPIEGDNKKRKQVDGAGAGAGAGDDGVEDKPAEVKKPKIEAENDDDDDKKPPKDPLEILADANTKTELTQWVNEKVSTSILDHLTLWQNPDAEVKQDSIKFVVLPELKDKDTRRAVHGWIRQKLPNIALGDTQDGRIRIWHKRFERQMPNFGKFDRADKQRGNHTIREPKGWPQGRPNFLQFVLYKENLDTGVAVKDLTRKMRGKARVGYAGMKDKRGVTTQFITLYRRKPSEIIGVNRSNDRGGGNSNRGSISVIRVGNFEYVDTELQIGRLQGNRFDVVLRNVDIAENKDGTNDKIQERKLVLEEAAKAMKKTGFINYFGMQRFGRDHDTHKVGIEILKGNFQQAVDIIMRPKNGEYPKIVEARKKWIDRFEDIAEGADKAEVEAKCAKEVIKFMGRFMQCEVAMLNSLIRKPLDYRRAFMNIPRTMKLMFLHAVQSFLWNKSASYRIEKMGQSLCVGDLVQTESNEETDGTSGRKGKAVKVITQEDIANHTYGITDLVLPLVGCKISYPENEMTNLFDTLLEECGLSRKSFDKVEDRELSLGGDYRKVICKPGDLEYTIHEYSDPLQPLLQTDLMKVKNVEVKTNINNNQDDDGSDEKKDDAKPLIGMVVSFTLPPSAYATIALRELMKRPTSSEYQRLLNLEGSTEGKIQD